jgi:hypothetical protein
MIIQLLEHLKIYSFRNTKGGIDWWINQELSTYYPWVLLGKEKKIWVSQKFVKNLNSHFVPFRIARNTSKNNILKSMGKITIDSIPWWWILGAKFFVTYETSIVLFNYFLLYFVFIFVGNNMFEISICFLILTVVTASFWPHIRTSNLKASVSYFNKLFRR